ncbi:MAG: hypothetical protein DHS20C18_14550 [Saprospiraceae bacterium]|nr:MAG: hypothetical protein DHS20C18_14550 [Saprospiraceae bacterium]
MDEYRSIGRTQKTYGVAGALRLNIKDQYLDDLFEAKVLFLSLQGQLIPYFVETIDDQNNLLVKFEEINSPEQARELTNAEVFLRESDLADINPKDELNNPDWDRFKDWLVVDEQGKSIGPILEIQEFPQQLMALVNYQDREVFIPLNDTFLVGVDEKKRQLMMELPDGLLALN